ncbi:MAG: murein biosynthesis integral membrane protein MurJ [Patescibacteria group bacterium]
MRGLRNIFTREEGGLHGAAFLLGVSSLASGVLALVRDRIFAHTLGAGSELDIYYASFRIPDFLFVTVASFVSMTVLIPILIKKMDGKSVVSTERAADFLAEVLTVFCFVMAVVSVALFVAMPWLSYLVAPGFGEAARAEFVHLARILLLSPFLLGVSNLLGSVTQSLRRFAVYALAPLVYNLGIILGALFLYPYYGLTGLVMGVILGALLHGAIQLPTVRGAGFSLRLARSINWTEMREVIRLSLPRTAGLGMSQLVILVLIALASYMKEGSIAIFNFALNLQSVPLSIVGVSYSVAAFPKLSEHIGKGERGAFVRHVLLARRQITLFSLPLLLGGILLRKQLVYLLLGTGQFSVADTALTADALGLFLISLWAQGLLLLYTRSYYAAGETRKPVIANAFASVVTILLAVVLVQAYGTVLALPLAFSIGMILNVCLHWRSFSRDFGTVT